MAAIGAPSSIRCYAQHRTKRDMRFAVSFEPPDRSMWNDRRGLIYSANRNGPAAFIGRRMPMKTKTRCTA